MKRREIVDEILANLARLAAAAGETSPAIEGLRARLEDDRISTARLEHVRGDIAAMLND